MGVVVDGPDAPDERAEVRVGCLWSETGWCWLDCRAMSLGVKFWIADTNARGGMFVPEVGRRLPVRLVTGDDRSSPPHAVELYRQMLEQDGVDVVVSGGSSEIQELAVPLTEAAGIVNLNAGAPEDDGVWRAYVALNNAAYEYDRMLGAAFDEVTPFDVERIVDDADGTTLASTLVSIPPTSRAAWLPSASPPHTRTTRDACSSAHGAHIAGR